MLFFVFGTGIIMNANTHREKINIKSLIINQKDSYSNILNTEPEQLCRNMVEIAILRLYDYSDMSLGELSKLESRMLIKCFNNLL